MIQSRRQWFGIFKILKDNKNFQLIILSLEENSLQKCKDPNSSAYKTEEIWRMPVECTNASFLVLILYYNYVHRYQWGKLSEGYTGPLYYFSSFLWIYNFQNKKFNKKQCFFKETKTRNQWLANWYHKNWKTNYFKQTY